MRLIYSDFFRKKLNKKLKKNPELKSKISKQLKLLQKDINYPSLKTHKLKGKRAHQYSVWIEGNLRITFVIFGDDLLLTDVVNHDEY